MPALRLSIEHFLGAVRLLMEHIYHVGQGLPYLVT